MKVNFFSNNNVQFPDDGKGIFLTILITLLCLASLVVVIIVAG